MSVSDFYSSHFILVLDESLETRKKPRTCNQQTLGISSTGKVIVEKPVVKQPNKKPAKKQPNNKGAAGGQPDNEGAAGGQPNNEGAAGEQPDNEGAAGGQPNNEGAAGGQPNNEEAAGGQPNNKRPAEEQSNNEGAAGGQPDNGLIVGRKELLQGEWIKHGRYDKQGFAIPLNSKKKTNKTRRKNRDQPHRF